MGSALTAAALGVPDAFNAADYFVDRHVQEGRGARVAIECGDERVTYAELFERVNRFGSALRGALGVRPEERVALLLLDSSGLRVSASSAPSRLAPCRSRSTRCGRRLTTRTCCATRRAGVVVVSRELLPELEKIPPIRCAARSAHVVVVDSAGRVRRAACSDGSLDARRARDEPRRSGVLAVLLRQHGPAERMRASAARHGRLRRAVRERASSASPPRDRCFSVAKLFFAYGLGNARLFSACRRRDQHPLARAAAAGARVRDHRATPADAVLLGADRLRDAARARRGRSICRRSGSPCRPAKRCRRRFTSDSSSGSASTSSTASGRPRRSTCSSRTGPA